jgi:hypothetical protein
MLVTTATFVSDTATVAKTSAVPVSASTTFPLIVMKDCWSAFFFPFTPPEIADSDEKASRRAIRIIEIFLKVFMALFILVTT